MKKFLSLVLALVMTMSLVTISAGAKDFTDDSKITYKEAVDVLSAVKVIDGYTDGSFNPSATLSRGAAAKIICNLILGPTTASALSADAAPFKDVPADSTFAGYIAYCSKAGIISGYADGTFKPGATLTTYAYMKMLLGALGYDKDVEGYAGANWSINVAKQALNIGLDKGLKTDLDGTKPVTREEACLFALNTLKADLVEYEAKTSINVGGAEVVIAGSKAQAVTSTKDSKSIKDETAGSPSANTPDVVQFAEKYFPKLSLTGSDDAFMRPSNLWKLKGVKIGNYAKTPDLTYTKKTKSDTIYDDLGLSETIVATTYEDGANQGTFTVKNGDTDSKIGKPGVLTEVFKTETADRVYLTITKVNTYVGDVTAKVAATKTKDAYVSIAARLDGAKAGNFDTTDFALDDVVLYTYSEKQSDGSDMGVQSVVAAEIVPGTLTGFTVGDSATVGGTKYDYAYKVAHEAGQADVNTEVKVVLDTYGNAIDIDGAKDANYAVVLDSSVAGLHKEAKLLFTDGTVKIVNTDAHYNGEIGNIVSYIIKSGDSYKLTRKAAGTTVVGGSAAEIKNNTYDFDVNTENAGGEYTANGKTIFLVKTQDANGDAMYKAYEGIKNVPSVKLPATSNYAVFCKLAGNLANIVYLDATKTGSSVLDPSSDVIFVKGTDDVSYTSGVGSYYKYSTALVNGEKPEDDVKATTHVADDTYAMFDGVSYDANGVVTMTASDNVIVGTGVYKQANEVLGTNNVDVIGDQGHTNTNATTKNGAVVNQYAYYPVAKDLKVAIIDEDGDLTTGYTINSVAKDSNDVIFFKLNNSKEITYAVILKVAGNVQAADLYNVTLTAPVAGFTYTVKKGTDIVATDTMSGTTETIGLEKGTYTVTFAKAGYVDVTTSLTVTADGGSAEYATVYALTVTGTYTGAVNPVLTVKDSSGNVVFSKTNPAASETVHVLKGNYTATFTADNYEALTATATVTTTPGATAAIGGGNKASFTTMQGTNTITVNDGTDDVIVYAATGAAADVYTKAAIGGYTYSIESSKIVVNGTGTLADTAVNYVDLTGMTLADGGSQKLSITATGSGLANLPSTWKVDVLVEKAVAVGSALVWVEQYTEDDVDADDFSSAWTTTNAVETTGGSYVYHVVLTLKDAAGNVLDVVETNQVAVTLA